jgi:hypothetical protein
MRILWNNGGNYTCYEYAPDHRLLRATREWDNTVFEFAHDEQGRRVAKFHDGTHEFVFVYRDNERTPHAMQRDDGQIFTLHCDQIGSLRVVADQRGNVIQEILYDPFGTVIKSTNPEFRVPLGFAGGLHDRDLGSVRFGWRDKSAGQRIWTSAPADAPQG